MRAVRFIRAVGLPIALALLLHALLAAALLRGWQAQADEREVVTPRIVQAKLLVMEKPKRKAAPQPRPAKPAVPKPKPQPRETTPQPQPKPPAAPKPVPKPDREAEREAREEVQRQQRLRELYERSTALALQDEQVDVAADVEARTMTYVEAIYQAVHREWSRPPSARNDMEVRIQVDLTPSGDLLGVAVVDSSGNSAFDRSAEAAVRKAARSLGRFPVPEDRRLFEANFRNFTLLFKPEDLLR